jgi:hypothetical protein
VVFQVSGQSRCHTSPEDVSLFQAYLCWGTSTGRMRAVYYFAVPRAFGRLSDRAVYEVIRLGKIKADRVNA